MVVDDVEGGDAFALGDEHADQLTERDRRHDDPTLGASQSGHRDLARLCAPLPSYSRRIESEYLRSWLIPSTREISQRSAAMPICPSPIGTLGADVLLVEAAARHRVQRASLLVEQQHHRVAVAEQLVERTQARCRRARRAPGARAQPSCQLGQIRRADRQAPRTTE
jgi:hypothetical protein